jgi:hypothetical protein
MASAVSAGTLKVTSFPSGAQVTVDGVNTGKVTPMNIALADGDHIVRVEIPGSGWSADTRTVSIVAGNNDLSVTLLPTLTTGPQGPQGPQGPPGSQGAQGPSGAQGPAGSPGAPATVRAASSAECANGGIVVASGDGLISLPVCNGARGLQGAQGIQGVAGPAGPPGPAGGGTVVDPTTIVSFGTNLRVKVGDYQGTDLGLSAVYVEIANLKEDFGVGEVHFSPGLRRLAPFAIAATQSNDANELNAWFELVRQGKSQATRSISVQIVDIFKTTGPNVDLEITLTGCQPVALAPPQFGSSVIVSAIVDCDDAIEIPTIHGGTASIHGVGLSTLSLAISSHEEIITDVSGGGERVIGDHTEIAPLSMFVGTREGSFNPDEIISWVRESLGLQQGNIFRDIDLRQENRDNTVTTVAHYDDVFLTGITLIDPSRVFESGVNTLFRIGFGLAMQANGH